MDISRAGTTMGTTLIFQILCFISMASMHAIRYSARYVGAVLTGDGGVPSTSNSHCQRTVDNSRLEPGSRIAALSIAGAGLAVLAIDPSPLPLLIALSLAVWGMVVAIRTDLACREIPLAAQLALALAGLAFGYMFDGTMFPACLRMLAGAVIGFGLWFATRGEAGDGQHDGFGLGDAMLLASMGSVLISVEAAAIAFSCLGLCSVIVKLRRQRDMAGAPPLIGATLAGLAGHWIILANVA